MKVFAVCLVLFLTLVGFSYGVNTIQDDVEPRGILENTINSTINNILANVSDPLTLSDINLNFNTDVLSGYGNVSNLHISGISSLVASYIKVNIFGFSLEMTLKLSQLIVTSKYTGDLVLANLIPFYGDGRVSAILDDLELGITGKVNLTGGMSISNATITITLDDATFDLHGLIYNDEFSSLVSNILNDNVVVFIANNQDLITNVTSPIAQQLINSVLKGGNSTLSATENFEYVLPEESSYVIKNV